MSSFSDRLKELRKAKGVTQKAMAEYLGMVERSYRRYEAGDLEPNHETTIKLADYFDVTVDYLLGRVNYSVDANGRIAIKTSPNVFNLDNEQLNKKSNKN